MQHNPTPGSDPLGREPVPAWLPTAPHLEAFSRGLSCGGCQQGRWICGDQCPHSGHERCRDIRKRVRTTEFRGCLPVAWDAEPVMSAAWTPNYSSTAGERPVQPPVL